MTRLAILFVIGIVSAACQQKPAGQSVSADSASATPDSVGVLQPTGVTDTLFSSLQKKLAPLDASFDSVPVLLRPDSATPRADSTFLAVKESLSSRVRSVSQTFDDSAFQILMYPQGARGQQVQRHLDRSGMPVPPADTLLADSVHRFLDAHGIWSYPAEGDTYFVLSLTRLGEVAAPFITESSREYLRIETREQLWATGGDAAVNIPWDSLGDRLADTDYFLARFPEAPVSIAVRERRIFYLRAFLTGWDNTNVFFSPGADRNLLRPEVRASFERYVATHGSTESADVVRRYLQLLRQTQFRRTPAVREFLRTQSGLPEHGANEVFA